MDILEKLDKGFNEFSEYGDYTRVIYLNWDCYKELKERVFNLASPIVELRGSEIYKYKGRDVVIAPPLNTIELMGNIFRGFYNDFESKWILCRYKIEYLPLKISDFELATFPNFEFKSYWDNPFRLND